MRPVLGRQLACSLDLDDDRPEADKVRHVGLGKTLALVGQGGLRFRSVRNAALGEFQGEAFLVDGLKKAAPIVLLTSKMAPWMA